MKYKAIIGIAILMLILNIGLANTDQRIIDKETRKPQKSRATDFITVTNNYYDLIVEDSIYNQGIGTYTVRTGSSHPATIAAGGVKQNVLYGGQDGDPWSTYLSVKSYTSNTNYYTAGGYLYADSGCTGMQLDWTSTSVTQPTPTSILCVWDVIGENDFLKIKQLTFIDGTSLDNSKIGVTTTVKNTGYDTVKIGIRYEWDIMIDGWDGSTMREKSPQGPWLFYETTWNNFNYTHYEITDSIEQPTFYNLGTATGPTYLTPPPTSPDKMIFGSWYYSYDYAFNYTPTGVYLYQRGVGGTADSDIMYYWGDNLANAKVLAPGDSVMVTQYLFASVLLLTYQPDNHIKNSDETSYIGNNIYNLNGENQTKTQTASTTDPAIYHIKIENDGNSQDYCIVNEVPTDGNVTDRQYWNVQYYDALIGGSNITTQMTSTGWNTGAIPAGRSREIRMEVTPDIGISNGSTKQIDILSTSANDNSKKDVVRTITTAVTQAVHDVGAYQIIAPIGFINAGQSVTPKTIVENYGDFTETFDVAFTFFGYGDTQTVTNLAPGAIDTVEFDNWTAIAGSYLVTSYTMLSGDENNSNNTTYMEFSVTGAQVPDVGVTEILAPIDTIIAGSVVIPKAIVCNFGAGPEKNRVQIPVTLKFGTYTSSRLVNLNEYECDTVEFDMWTAEVGNYFTIAYTSLIDDPYPYNDTTTAEFVVIQAAVHDVGVSQILAPITTLNVGDIVAPTVLVHNYGTENETSIPVHFNIGVYNSTRTVTLDVGATDTVEFDDWTAIVGSWTGTAYTTLESDNNHYNDTARYRFSVIETTMIDISIVDILVPDEPIVTCYNYEPAVLVHTQGASGPTPCSLLVRITRYPSYMIGFCNVGVDSLHPIIEYEQWVYTSVHPGYDTVYLPLWHPYWWDIDWTALPAYHEVYAEVGSQFDENPDNNTMLNRFTVDGRANDLQMNWTGLLDGYEVIHNDTIINVTYNVASAVSLSEGGPSARFRAWVNIIRESDDAVVYTRYKDVTMNAGTYYCIPYSTGWTATEPGSYIVRSWIEALPGVDVVPENSIWERKYYVILPVANANNTSNPTLQSSFGSTPNTFSLMANNPNPFSKITNIQWQIPIQSNVAITIYDATGKIVKNLVNENMSAGVYNLPWNRTDDNNRQVPAGIYFYEMKSGDYTARRKMIITN